MLGDDESPSNQNGRYYVKRASGKVFGPFDPNAIQMMLKAGKIGPEATVSVDKEDWKALGEVSAFAEFAEDDSGGDSTNQTHLGGYGSASGGEAEDRGSSKSDSDGPRLPASAEGDDGGGGGGPRLPTPADESDGDAGPPDLPTPKSGGASPDDGPGLPTPADGDAGRDDTPDLPASKERGGDGGGSPGLPKSKESEEEDPIALGNESNLPGLADDPDDEDDADLPTSADRKGSSDEQLPRSAEENLPTSGDSDRDLPRSADDNLPTSGKSDGDLPRSADDNLPQSGASGEELPRSATDTPSTSTSDGSDAGQDSVDDLFSEEPGEDDLFGDGADAGADGEGPDEDLFAVDDSGTAGGEDLFADEPEEDELFGDEEAEDDLFAEPDDEGDDDLFGDDPGDDDLFEASEPHTATASEPEQSEESEELFAGDESLELDEDAAGVGAAPPPEEDELEIGTEPEDEPADQTGAAAESAPETGVPDVDDDLELDESAARDAGVERGGPGGAPPASRGMPAGEAAGESGVADEAEAAAERARSGSSIVRTVVLLSVLAVVTAGAGVYYYFYYSPSAGGDESPQSRTDKPVGTLDLNRARKGTYPALEKLLDGVEGAELSGEKQGKYLLVASLFLSRYDSDSVEDRGSSTANALEDASDGIRALGRGAWAAKDGNVEVARSYLEPLFESNDDVVSYFAHLTAGIGHVKALERRAAAEGSREGRRAELPATAGGATEAPEALAGDSNAAAAESADAGSTGDTSSDASGDAGSESVEHAGRATLVERGAKLLETAAHLKENGAEPEYWTGRLQEANGDEKKALETYRAAIGTQNDHVASRLRAAHLHYEAGDLEATYDGADTILSELGASAGPPESAEAYHLVGMVEQARAKHRKAIEAFQKAIEKDSNRPETIRRLTSAYETSGDWQQALKWFQSHESLGKEHPELLLGLVRAHMGLEQWQSAINVLEKGEERFPNNARFPYLLGELHRERGAFTEARKAMQRAVQNDPGLLDAYGSLAQLTWKLDENLKQAEYYIDQITKHPQKIDASVATKVAGFYRMSDRRAIAEKWYREALDRNPNHLPARLQLAKLYLEKRSGAKALDVLEQARDSGVDDLRLSAYLADAYRQTGKYDRALEAINEVLDRSPDNHEYLFIRGLIHFDRESYANARRDFVQAHDRKPLFDRAYFYTGRVAFERGKYEDALKIMRQVLDDDPENGEYRYWMGRILEKRGRLEDALKEYRKVTKYDEAYGVENPNLYVRRGQLLVELGYTRRGKKEIRKALEIEPELQTGRIAMAEAHFATKEYEAAIDEFERALESDGSIPSAQYKLGMALVYQEQKREGANHLQKAVELGYEDPEVYETLGYLYKELGQPQLAVESFKSYLREADEEEIAPTTRREMLHQIEELGG